MMSPARFRTLSYLNAEKTVRTRIFHGHLENAAYGRNIRICATVLVQPGSLARHSGASLHLAREAQIPEYLYSCAAPVRSLP